MDTGFKPSYLTDCNNGKCGWGSGFQLTFHDHAQVIYAEDESLYLIRLPGLSLSHRRSLERKAGYSCGHQPVIVPSVLLRTYDRFFAGNEVQSAKPSRAR